MHTPRIIPWRMIGQQNRTIPDCKEFVSTVDKDAKNRIKLRITRTSFLATNWDTFSYLQIFDYEGIFFSPISRRGFGSESRIALDIKARLRAYL